MLARFLSVGGLSTAVHLSVAWLAFQLPGSSSAGANLAGFLCASTVAYFGHFYWTFESRAGHGRSLSRFPYVALYSLATSTLCVYVVCEWLGYSMLAALVVVGILVAPVSFLLSRFWVFRGDDLSDNSLAWSVFVCATSAACAFWFYGGRALNHDTSWYLIATSRWLDGAMLYRDIVEINPPLAFYLTAPPVWLANALGMDQGMTYVGYLCLLGALSSLCVQRLLAHQLGRHQQLVMTAAAITLLFLLPVNSFGQREHLMLIFALPYLFAGLFGMPASRLQRLLLGVAALPGLLLKPHFLLIPAMLGTLQAVRSRSIRAALGTEHLIMLAGTLSYLSFIVLWHPLYLSEIVPAATWVYGSFGLPAGRVLASAGLIGLLPGLWLLYRLSGSDQANSAVAMRLAVLCLATALVYLLQFKGWRYQLLPLHAALVLLCGWCVLQFPRADSRRRLDRPLLLLLLICSFVPVAAGPYRNHLFESLSEHVIAAPLPKSMLVLTAHVWATFPLANQLDVTVASRYPALWLVPGAVAGLANQPNGRERDNLERILTLARDTTTEDFILGTPALVIVDTRAEKPYFNGVEFDYLQWFKGHPEFARAWEDYRRIGRVSGFEIWLWQPEQTNDNPPPT